MKTIENLLTLEQGDINSTWMFTWPAVSTTSSMYSWLLCFSLVVNAEKNDKAEVTCKIPTRLTNLNLTSRKGPRFHFRFFFRQTNSTKSLTVLNCRIVWIHKLSLHKLNCNWRFSWKEKYKKIQRNSVKIDSMVTQQKLPAISVLQVASTIQKLPTERNPITTIFLDFAGAIVKWKMELSLTYNTLNTR